MLGVYIRGQLLIIAIVAFLYLIGFGFAGVPLWPLIAVFGGLLEFIPNFGSLIALTLALFSSWSGGADLFRMGIVLAIWLAVQAFQGFYLVPRFLGRRLGLNPLVVFLGVLIGGLLFPPFGVFLAIPVLAVANVVRLFLRARNVTEAR
ncbi:MAG: AI-2E family transporter [Acidobacteriota bacterium]|nr:AI-2E family transporter [Acidobacteriota bacterium]